MKRYFYPVAILSVGVLSAQALFSILVFFSNSSLYNNLTAFKASGYLIVPNALIMPSLQEIWPAVCGGLFFALTTGAGISLVTFICLQLWHRYSRQFWVLGMLIAGAFIFFAVQFDYNVWLTLVCLLIIIAVVFANGIFFYKTEISSAPFLRIAAGHLAAIVIIVLIWMPVVNKDMFVSIRDNLLLTNPAGRAINDFYYKYTLYPAELFKSLDQKLLKSCRITGDGSALLDRQIKDHLMVLDYLPVAERFSSDVMVKVDGTNLDFLHNGRTVHTCSVDEFQKDSEEIMEVVSQQTDDYAFLRKITFLSLVAASPLLCYIVVHALFMMTMFFIKSNSLRFMFAVAGCLLVFAMPAILFYGKPAATLEKQEIGRRLRSEDVNDRIAALKILSEMELRLDRYIDPRKLSKSTSTVERYWLAKNLGHVRSPESYQLIVNMLDDPQPNVVCMALYSLGQQKQIMNTNKIISQIIRRIDVSKHWYVQWYAYKALKRLGWTQAEQIR